MPDADHRKSLPLKISAVPKAKDTKRHKPVPDIGAVCYADYRTFPAATATGKCNFTTTTTTARLQLVGSLPRSEVETAVRQVKDKLSYNPTDIIFHNWLDEQRVVGCLTICEGEDQQR